MSDILDTTSDYIKSEETKTLQIDSETDKIEVRVDDKLYGINKPQRITIRATISHDKS